MGYETKYREQVMKFIDKGNTVKAAHELFDVGESTIKEWKKLRKETGGLEKRSLNRKPAKLCPERLRIYINEHPDSYLSEIAEAFNCTVPAVFYALKRMKITRKKNG